MKKRPQQDEEVFSATHAFLVVYGSVDTGGEVCEVEKMSFPVQGTAHLSIGDEESISITCTQTAK